MAFRFDALVFDVLITCKDTEEQYTYTFRLTRNEPSESSSIHQVRIAFLDGRLTQLGDTLISDTNTESEFLVPAKTAYLQIIYSADGNGSFVRWISDESGGEDLNSCVQFLTENDFGSFELHYFNGAGNELASVHCCAVRRAMSSDASLYRLGLSAFDINGALIGNYEYTMSEIDHIQLPYGTAFIDVSPVVSSCASVTYSFNGEVVTELYNIGVDGEDLLSVQIVSEDENHTENVQIPLTVAEEPDQLGPVISLVGKSGRVYYDGSSIAERFDIVISDDSWYEISIYQDDEVTDTISYDGSDYCVKATDIFGNSSSLQFTCLPIASIQVDYEFIDNSSIHLTGVIEGSVDSKRVLCAAYSASGKQLGVAVPEIQVDGSFACTLSAEGVAYVKVFLVTEDWQPLDMQRIDLS